MKTQTLFALKDLIILIINSVLVPLIFAVAFVVFIWGIFKYFIKGAADPKAREEGGKFLLYGLIGFAVMVSVWGLVNVVTGTFGFETGSAPKLPLF